MEATAAGLTTGTLGAFTVVHGAAADIVLTGSTADLTSGADRVLTATIKDAAGNAVTSDNSTVVSFSKTSGAGSVTGRGTATAVERHRDEDGHRRARRLRHDGGHRGRPHAPAASAPSPSSTAPPRRSRSPGATSDLASGGTRLLTATVQDAAGNTITSDNRRRSASPRRAARARSRARAGGGRRGGVATRR